MVEKRIVIHEPDPNFRLFFDGRTLACPVGLLETRAESRLVARRNDTAVRYQRKRCDTGKSTDVRYYAYFGVHVCVLAR